jgi:FtsP/CotA-like multicopper oxidase with cupredoxin domain
VRGQYLDGLRGPLIIHDPENPFRAQFDEEMVLTLSDWYHKEMAELMPKYKNGGGMMSREPVPDANLLNDSQNLQVAVQPAKTYLVHAVNIGAFVGQYFWVEGHTLTIVELDGSYVRPTVAEMIYLASGQRCSFLLTTKAEASHNYPMVASMDRVRMARILFIAVCLLVASRACSGRQTMSTRTWWAGSSTTSPNRCHRRLRSKSTIPSMTWVSCRTMICPSSGHQTKPSR